MYYFCKINSIRFNEYFSNRLSMILITLYRDLTLTFFYNGSFNIIQLKLNYLGNILLNLCQCWQCNGIIDINFCFMLCLLQTPRHGQGLCAYLDNTGQRGWFNYPCNRPRYDYRISFVCKTKGINIRQILKI